MPSRAKDDYIHGEEDLQNLQESGPWKRLFFRSPFSSHCSQKAVEDESNTVSALSGDLRLSWQQNAFQPLLCHMFCGLAMLRSIDLPLPRANM